MNQVFRFFPLCSWNFASVISFHPYFSSILIHPAEDFPSEKLLSRKDFAKQGVASPLWPQLLLVLQNALGKGASRIRKSRDMDVQDSMGRSYLGLEAGLYAYFVYRAPSATPLPPQACSRSAVVGAALQVRSRCARSDHCSIEHNKHKGGMDRPDDQCSCCGARAGWC